MPGTIASADICVLTDARLTFTVCIDTAGQF